MFSTKTRNTLVSRCYITKVYSSATVEQYLLYVSLKTELAQYSESRYSILFNEFSRKKTAEKFMRNK